MPLDEVIDLPTETLIDCRIDRADKGQSDVGGTDYNWDKPDVVFASVQMAIQTLGYEDINYFAQRNIQVNHVAYTNVCMSNVLNQGDRIKDGRYSNPDVYYIVKDVKDMGGVGVLWAVYCTLQE